MNRLDVRSRADASLDQIVTELLVDGQLLVDFKKHSYAVDLAALERSLRHPGEYYIVTCICGYPACAGIKRAIRVDHAADRVDWVVRGLGEVRRFAFDARQCRDAVREGIARLRQLVDRCALDAVPEINNAVVGRSGAPP